VTALAALFSAILNMSITASIVALAVLLMRIPLKKAPKIFSYILWGIVLFRLIFPFSIESIFSLMPNPENIIPQGVIFMQNPTMQAVAQLPTDITGMPLVQESAASFAITPIEIATYIWLLGFAILLIYAVAGYIGLKQRIRFATLVQDNIYETDQIETPFVLGFIRPKIYFPVATCHLDYIVKHEQIHIKRRDYLIKPLAFFIFALHWFNPLMWIAYALMSKDMEMSCDEAVLKSADEDIRRDYSMSLLNLSVKRGSLLSPLAFGESNVKTRIANVIGFKKTKKWLTVVSSVAVAAFLVGFIFDTTTAHRPTYHVTSYSINSLGWRVADAHEAEEITWSVLGEYFSAFRSDWSNWELNPTLSLIENAQWPDGEGYIHVIDTWFGRVSDNAVDEHRIFIPPLIYYFSDTTGEIMSIMYSPPIEFTATNYSPFAISFEAAFETNQFYPFPTEFMTGDYRNMLIEVATQHTRAAGFADVVFADIDYIQWFSFDGLLLSVGVNVTSASGDNVQFIFWVSEEGFALVGFRIDFAQFN